MWPMLAGLAGGDLDQSLLVLLGFLTGLGLLLIVLAYLEPGSDVTPLRIHQRLATFLFRRNTHNHDSSTSP